MVALEVRPRHLEDQSKIMASIGHCKQLCTLRELYDEPGIQTMKLFLRQNTRALGKERKYEKICKKMNMFD